jgi:hypothetical protein
LVLNAITAEDDLIDDLVNAPTLTNVYSGHLPSGEIPHDGFWRTS